MSSDRNMERERFRRDAGRAGFIETEPGEWVRASQIEMVRAPRDVPHERGAGCVFSVVGCDEAALSPLTPEQLMRAIVAAQGRDLS